MPQQIICRFLCLIWWIVPVWTSCRKYQTWGGKHRSDIILSFKQSHMILSSWISTSPSLFGHKISFSDLLPAGSLPPFLHSRHWMIEVFLTFNLLLWNISIVDDDGTHQFRSWFVNLWLSYLLCVTWSSLYQLQDDREIAVYHEWSRRYNHTIFERGFACRNQYVEPNSFAICFMIIEDCDLPCRPEKQL